MTCGWRKGDGSPHARGQRRWGCGMTCGWRKGDGSPHARGQRRWGCGVTCGWRKGDGSPHPRGQGRGWEWIPAPICTGQALCGNDGGRCGTAGERAGRLSEVRKRGWVPACARTREGMIVTRIPSTSSGHALAFPLKGGGRRRAVREPPLPRGGRSEGVSRCRRGPGPPSWPECPGSRPAARLQRSALRRERRRWASFRRRPLAQVGAGGGRHPGKQRRKPRR